jgi:phosphatidylglycerophosphatase A
MSSARRHIDWTRIRTPLDWLSVTISLAGGAGLSPRAPGTAGTAIALPLIWIMAPAPLAFKIVIWLVLLAAGIWAATHFDRLMKTGDHQSIVMDEVVGMGITGLLLPADWSAWPLWILAFGLFRLLDVWKPFPIRIVDRWSHQQGNLATGLGVMLDDVLAGLMGLGVLQAVRALFVL